MRLSRIFGVQGTATPLFGDETATEKVLQILKSDIIKNFIVAKYDLMNHYGISKGSEVQVYNAGYEDEEIHSLKENTI